MPGCQTTIARNGIVVRCPNREYRNTGHCRRHYRMWRDDEQEDMWLYMDEVLGIGDPVTQANHLRAVADAAAFMASFTAWRSKQAERGRQVAIELGLLTVSTPWHQTRG